MREVHFAAAQFGELFRGNRRRGVRGAGDRKADQRLVQVEGRVAALEDVALHVRDGLDDVRGDEVDLVGNAGEQLDGVEDHGGGRVQLVRVVARDDASVLELDGRAGDDGAAGLALAGVFGVLNGLARGLDGDAVLVLEVELVHERIHAGDGITIRDAEREVAELAQIAADDLLLGGLPHDVVVDDAKADAVHAHVRGGLVGALAVCHLFPDGAEKGIGLDVAIVVHRRLPVRLQVVRIDHIEVLEVDRGGFVGDVERVFERHVPHGERLELRVAGLASLTGFVVDLRKAGGELARTRAGGRDDDDRTLRGDVVVLAVAVVGDDRRDIGWVALRHVMEPHVDATVLETLAELKRRGLPRIACDDDAAHEQAEPLEVVDQFQRVVGVGDAEVGTHLLVLDVARIDGDEDLRLVAEGLQQSQLHVRIVAGQAARRVEVVHQLAAELKVEFAEALCAAADFLGLFREVFFVVETEFHVVDPISI